MLHKEGWKYVQMGFGVRMKFSGGVDGCGAHTSPPNLGGGGGEVLHTCIHRW